VKPVLVDTSFIVALYNTSDRHHSRCVRVLDTLEQPTATCEAVVTESCYMLRNVRGAVRDVLATIESEALRLPFQLERSAGKVLTIFEKYRDLPASFADSCLVQMADELDTGDILTLDSDFKHYRWRRNRAFRFLISLER
jgi:predicted nucleic acid-binding protein